MPSPFIQGVSRFFRWWGGELATCLPARLREGLGRGRHRLVIEISDTQARFRHGKGRDLHELGEVSISQGDLAGQRSAGQHGAVRDILGKARLGAAEVVVRLPREKVLRRMVELPAAAAENLREVLGFEMDRHTPFKAGEVYYDYRLEASDPERKRIKVDLVVVPKAAADQAVRLVTSWGIVPDQLTVDGDGEEGARVFRLLPDGVAARAGGLDRRLSVALALAACVLLVLALYLPLRQKQEVVAASEAHLAVIRAEAEQAGDLKKQVEEMLERSGFVVARKARQRTAIELFDEVTRVLPDHTWILKFGVRDTNLTLSGYSAKPSALIGLLEQSEVLREVRFSSPVTMDQKMGLERFNLTATVTPRGQP